MHKKFLSHNYFPDTEIPWKSFGSIGIAHPPTNEHTICVNVINMWQILLNICHLVLQTTKTYPVAKVLLSK